MLIFVELIGWYSSPPVTFSSPIFTINDISSFKITSSSFEDILMTSSAYIFGMQYYIDNLPGSIIMNGLDAWNELTWSTSSLEVLS